MPNQNDDTFRAIIDASEKLTKPLFLALVGQLEKSHVVEGTITFTAKISQDEDTGDFELKCIARTSAGGASLTRKVRIDHSQLVLI